MDRKKAVGDIHFKTDSDRLVIFIHGYTGSTHDFRDLPEIVHREFNATVYVPLLPGHGTSIDNLFDLTCENLLVDIEQNIKAAIQQGKQIILIGISFGAQAALYLSSKYKVLGVISISTTHTLKFPFNIPGLGFLKLFKRKWKKQFSPSESRLRNGTFYYEEMLADGLGISKKLKTLVNASAKNICQPVFFVHAQNEKLASPRSIQTLSKIIQGNVFSQFIKNDTHNLFFSDTKDQVVSGVISFLKSSHLFENEKLPQPAQEKASAVVPAFNEGPRIEAVLSALSKTPGIEEIIVIDDGSTDDTSARAGKFKKAIRLVNKENKGKAACMDEGVKLAKNDIIFFCDADLVGFTEEHAEAIIAPVRENTYDMFIGMRGNIMQRSIEAWGLNSGERALRKKVWYSLPDFYKHGFRIEAGLNHHVKTSTKKGFGWQIFDYSQPLKETKYGVIEGTLLRWSMNIDVLATYLKILWKNL